MRSSVAFMMHSLEYIENMHIKLSNRFRVYSFGIHNEIHSFVVYFPHQINKKIIIKMKKKQMSDGRQFGFESPNKTG